MGVRGMAGAGVSVFDLSVGMAGQAAPIAFALGGVIALLTGFSYMRFGLAFRSAGGSSQGPFWMGLFYASIGIADFLFSKSNLLFIHWGK